MSFYLGDPQWDNLGLPGIAELPAIRWRQVNLDKVGHGIREEIVNNLRQILGL